MNTELKSTTKIVSVKARKQGGKKKAFHEMIPKKGITLAALKTKATKELEVPASKVEPWLKGFLRRGLIKLH